MTNIDKINEYGINANETERANFKRFCRFCNDNNYSAAFVVEVMEEFKKRKMNFTDNYGLAVYQPFLKEIQEKIDTEERKAAELKRKQKEFAEMVKEQMNTPPITIRVKEKEPPKRKMIDLDTIAEME